MHTGRDIESPFAEAGEAAVSPAGRGRRGRRRMSVPVVAGVLVAVLALGIGGWAVARHLGDPLRTLEAFPVAAYFDNHRSLEGARFRGDLRVEADLGWRPGSGRLMLFSQGTDTRPVAVFLPVAVADGVFFSKGQRWLAALTVGHGGLVTAESLQRP